MVKSRAWRTRGIGGNLFLQTGARVPCNGGGGGKILGMMVFNKTWGGERWFLGFWGQSCTPEEEVSTRRKGEDDTWDEGGPNFKVG